MIEIFKNERIYGNSLTSLLLWNGFYPGFAYIKPE